MRTVVIWALLIVGCGKKDGGGAHQPSKPDEREIGASELLVRTDPNRLSEDYTVNPAAADEKYKGKILETKMPWLMMEQHGGKTVIRAGRLVYRFATEEEAAKVKPSTLYRVRGQCEGLVGNDIVLSKVWVLGEWEDAK